MLTAYLSAEQMASASLSTNSLIRLMFASFNDSLMAGYSARERI
jgi:hypothetical protein